MFSRLAHRLYSTAAAAPPTVLEYRVPYFVHRTKPGLQLPVYPRYTYKGTQCATFVRRIEGNGKVLAEQIRAEFPDWTVAYNTTTNQIKIKGYVVPQLRQFLTERGF
ncbi:hypothetical protein GGF31_000480 [Allomyces arbusculus]|nr:hypothetical protein GGF31_000480 [Allomyces arbusculus]